MSPNCLLCEAGRVVEFGTPKDLLGNKGYFFRMARDTGLLTAYQWHYNSLAILKSNHGVILVCSLLYN